MVTRQSQAFDREQVCPLDGHRQTLLLDDPSEIVEGDWLRDLGTFRRVRVVEHIAPDRIGVGGMFVVRFVSQPGVADWPLGITSRTKVTVWRDLGAS
jgi:hypothetical protein